MIETREINDNVIPSSNAMMAENLLRSSVHMGRPEWGKHAKKMLSTITTELCNYPRAYSYWLRLALNAQKKQREIVIVGPHAFDWMKILQQSPLENTHWAASQLPSNLPLLLNRYSPKETLIYVCENNHCNVPFKHIDEAKKGLGLT